MKLVQLFDARFQGRDWGAFAGPNWGIAGHHDMFGTALGDRVAGKLRCLNHPRQRVDGVWLPEIHGVIETDTTPILFHMRGYNRCSITTSPDRNQTRDMRVEDGDLDGRVTLSVIFTANEPYEWLNEVFGLVEGVMWAPMDESDPQWERWKVRVYECVNEMPWIEDVERSHPAPVPPSP
jgi:hypothetical protein